MAELRTEEEQLEAIKRWWKDNGVSLIAGVAIAAAGVFGWNAWQDYQANQAEAASMRYQQLINLTAGETLDTDTIEQARGLVDEITAEHGETLYADLARLVDARLAVTEDDHDAAREALETVAAESSRDFLAGLARLRLARLQVADDAPEAALETLDDAIPEVLAGQRADIRGDALLALDREDEAREAWQEALELADANDQPLYGVELKLDNLGADEATL